MGAKGKPDCSMCKGWGWIEVGINKVDIDCPECFPETVKPRPCCMSFENNGEHSPGCRTPVFERLAAERKRKEIPGSIKAYETWTWECTECGVGVIGDSGLEGAKAHTCADPDNWLKPLTYEDGLE